MNAIYMTLANLVLCAVWGWGSFLRLRVCHVGVVCRIRVIHSGMMVAAFASGFQLQLFGEYPGWADLSVSAVLAVVTVLGSRRWKSGVPNDLMKPINRHR